MCTRAVAIDLVHYAADALGVPAEEATRMFDLIEAGDQAGLQVLLGDYPSLIRLRSSDGRGPLFWAYEFSYRQIAKLLEDSGANQLALDSECRKPKDPLGRFGHNE